MRTSDVENGSIPCEILEDNAVMNATKRDPSFRDFLRFVAMRRSLSRAEEYEKLSDGAIPEEQKSFFSDMAELKQYEIECLRRYGSNGRIVSLDSKNQPRLPAPSDGPAQKRYSTLEDACRFAMNKELESYCLYLRLADLEEEMATKRLFLYLVRLLKSSLDHVQNRLKLIESVKELKTNEEAADICRNHPLEHIA